MTANAMIQDRLREYFEGKEAVYFEKGALVVRVSNPRVTTHYENPTHRPYEYAQADIEEIPTPGLPVRIPGHDRPARIWPHRWSVGTNLSRGGHFGPGFWFSGGYVSWRIYSSPKFVAEIVELAAGFREEELPGYNYWQVKRNLMKQEKEALQAEKLRRRASGVK